MGRNLLSTGEYREETTNLDEVTEATVGATIDCRWYKRMTWFINCTVNTGNVTVTIQASIDGVTWIDVDAKTYSASVTNDVYHYGYNTYYPYMRTKTTTQSNATLTTYIAARS